MAKVVRDNITQGLWGACIHLSPTFKPPLNSHEREILLDQLAVTLAFGRTADDTLPLKVSFLVTSLGMDHGRILFAIARLLQANVIDRDMIDFECIGPQSDTGGAMLGTSLLEYDQNRVDLRWRKRFAPRRPAP